jgi:N-acetyl-gamma-glutamyl-phosphate reductase
MKVAVIGSTGYTGMVLLRLLETHPEVEEILAVSSSKPGESVSAEDPGLGDLSAKYQSTGGKFLSVEEAAARKPDVVFAALPHLASAAVCAPFFGHAVVIDLSADFRIKDRAVFAQAYGQEPPRPDLLDQAVYGLAEWHTAAIRQADLIANPGCYTTSSLLPLLPLYRAGVVGGRAVINALSGISGAGKKADLKYSFTERTEGVQLYSPGRKHRHTQEIETELRFVAPEAQVLFNPHLVPLKRGMESTIVVDLAPGKTLADAEKAWSEAYAGRPFARYLGARLPASSEVWGSNRCDWAAVQEGGSLIVSSVLDNLVKGASGQAVQNLNLRFGFAETAGLSVVNQF